MPSISTSSVRSPVRGKGVSEQLKRIHEASVEFEDWKRQMNEIDETTAEAEAVLMGTNGDIIEARRRRARSSEDVGHNIHTCSNAETTDRMRIEALEAIRLAEIGVLFGISASQIIDKILAETAKNVDVAIEKFDVLAEADRFDRISRVKALLTTTTVTPS